MTRSLHIRGVQRTILTFKVICIHKYGCACVIYEKKSVIVHVISSAVFASGYFDMSSPTCYLDYFEFIKAQCVRVRASVRAYNESLLFIIINNLSRVLELILV